MPPEDAHRLPGTVAAEHYRLSLEPDLDAGTFAGEEEVHLRVHEPTDRVVLNAVDLDISQVEVAVNGTVGPAQVTLHEGEERAVISPERPLPVGTHTLRLRFSGRLNDKLRGFYKSVFTDELGIERTVAATQFEATDARRAFPCWDEPDRKASFAVTLVVDDHLTAISNSSVEEVTFLEGGKKRVRFAQTMRMSTYLVAFVVGPLAYTDPVDVDGVPLRVACVPAKRSLAGFAIEVAVHALRFFSRYFGIPYPADKLDLVALPDFAMGAMENLGAVTFRETLLLIDPDRATRLELERVADVVSHEIAHMWFGDLVTMRWWNGIWLNEAFATFMELLCVDELRPDWQRWVTFGLTRGSAMVTDGLAATRPVEFPVRRPQDAEAMFDVLTYQKGAAVVRMLERYVGAERFRQGIAHYIAKHSYANTETTDLWDAIEAATGEPARSVMDTWIFQGGHPMVSVGSDDEGRRLTFEQRRFRYLAGDDNPHERWQVPVLLKASVGGEVLHRRLLLTEETATLDLPGPPDWVVVNEGGWGFYRASYDDELFDRLRDRMAQLDALERFNLVSDKWAAVLAGLCPAGSFLQLVQLLGDEAHPSVWTIALGALDYLDRMIEPAQRPRLQAMVRQLVRPAFERVGWSPASGESETTTTLRGTLLQALGVLGADPEVRARAHELHDRYLRDRGSVDTDVAAAVMAVVATSGGEDEYASFLQRFRNPTTPQEEVRYLYALGGFEDEGLVRRTMEVALSEVRTQNAPFLISLLLANRVGGELAWGMVKEHWDELLGRFPENLHDRMLEGVATLSRPETAADVRQFLLAHPLPAKRRAVDQLLERLAVAVAFREREGPSLASAIPG